jgi:hypothetical protein
MLPQYHLPHTLEHGQELVRFVDNEDIPIQPVGKVRVIGIDTRPVPVLCLRHIATALTPVTEILQHGFRFWARAAPLFAKVTIHPSQGASVWEGRQELVDELIGRYNITSGVRAIH